MRMRAGVWWSVIALAFLAITSALRTTQGEGATRTSRRLATPSTPDSNSVADSGPDAVQPAFRSRGARRHEDKPSQRDSVRTRTRSRSEIPLTVQNSPSQPSKSNERFDSRRTRTRSQPVDVESKKDNSLLGESPIRSRSRGGSRRPSSTTLEPPAIENRQISSQAPTSAPIESRRTSSQSSTFAAIENRRPSLQTPSPPAIESRRSFTTSSTPASIESRRTTTISTPVPLESRRSTSTTSTEAPTEVTSPTIDDITLEITKSSISDITKIPKDLTTVATPQRRRNSVTTSSTTETPAPKRSRGRINTRQNTKSLDLIVSGTTNTLSITDRASAISRSVPDIRNAKKLRYRTRPTETDTNLTGEGLVTANEVIKSSQSKVSVTSQNDTITDAPVVPELIVQQSTEPNKQKTTTVKVTKVVRRPLARGKVNFRPTASLPKISKVSDEINEDDNYPPSFKALIQAKNASTVVSSTTGENLSLKASQKVYKTYSTSPQSTLTGPATNKYSRLRNKQAAEDFNNKNKEEDKIVEESIVKVTTKPKTTDYKPRGTYTPRNRKSTFVPSSTQSSSLSPNSEKPTYKFNRKFKVSTTVAPKIEIVKSSSIEQNNVLKKTFVRPPSYSRKFKVKTETKVAAPALENNVNSIGVAQKLVLPRTAFYARSRNNINKKEIPSTVDLPVEQKEEIVLKETVEAVDSPLVFALLNNSENEEPVSIDTQPENRDNHMFLIAVTSKESIENSTSNEVTNTAEESENKPVINTAPVVAIKLDSDKFKYHANYKDHNSTSNSDKDNPSSTAFPSVRNLQTKKYGRNRVKPNINDDISTTTPKPRERSIRKFSQSFSKTTEPSNNGITPEPEKSKSRFSSKYRASFIDKPFYKPTVPTITPSTAWLKFYVTDHLLTKSVEEPNWFEGDIYTTESMSRLNTTPYIHESSIELVEGEEIQLGPDLNAISFTQTRSKLSSADLRLSESLIKPSHVMNVEASHHSPSVTVSIFDALAEILTSTPRPQISTTTEMTKIQLPYTDVKQVLNGVSNSINVNSVKGVLSPDTFLSTTADVSTTTKTVQSTVQAPNVINSILVEGTATQPLNIEDGNVTPVNTLYTPNPSPISTTPVSARRPFAIRVLYSDTESPLDKLTTSSTTNQESTDTPKMVYKSVSDLLLSNNNVVSSELTSMLSNNIKDIIENMDPNSRSKLNSVDMERVLKTLIPRALNGLANALDNADSIPNTTPYSLEDIKDTENIDIDEKESNNALQSVPTETNVNITVENRNILNSDTQTIPNVNNPFTPTITESTQSVSNGAIITTIATVNTDANSELLSSATVSNTTPSDTRSSLSNSLGATTENLDSNIDKLSSDTTDKFVPLPFLTNFQPGDFTASDNIESTSSLPILKSVSLSISPSTGELQDPNMISPLQLWVLSKKAQVLKMIEDLIRQHNNELATAPPLTDFVPPSDNIKLSERLTDIMNGMITSTDTSTTRKIDAVNPTTTQSFIVNPLSTDSLEATTRGNSEISPLTTATSPGTSTVNNEVPSTESEVTLSPRFGSLEATSGTTGSSSIIFASTMTVASFEIPSTTIAPTSDVAQDEVTLSRLVDGTATTTVSILSKEILETTTAASDTGTTTQLNSETTTQLNSEITTQSNSDTITQPESTTINTDITTADVVDSNTTQISNLSIGTPTIPKKDYVIFGILPNNTVISTSALNIKSSNGITTTNMPEKSTASHVLSLRTTTMLPSIDEILLNSISSAAKQEMVISEMTSSTREPRILTLDIDPETKEIRTESPGEGNEGAVFKFIPIDEITVTPVNSNVQKLASTKLPTTGQTEQQTETITTVTAMNTQSSQLNTQETASEATTVSQIITSVMPETTVVSSAFTNAPATTLAPIITTETVLPSMATTTTPESTTTTTVPTIPITETTTTTTSTFAPITTAKITVTTTAAPTTTSTQIPTTTQVFSDVTTLLPATTLSIREELRRYQEDVQLLQTLLLATGRDPKSLNLNFKPLPLDLNNVSPTSTTAQLTTTTTPMTTTRPTTSTRSPTTTQQNDPAALLQALFTNLNNPTISTVSNFGGSLTNPTTQPTTITTRSLEDDIRQFEEDTKFLQALLQATGQNPAALNIPSLDSLTTIIPPTTTIQTTTIPMTTTTTTTTTTTARPSTTTRATTTQSIENDLKQIQEDTKFLQALLQATGQNPSNLNKPIVSGVSNVRIASNPQTTSLGSNPTTPLIVRPVYTTTNGPVYQTFAPRSVTPTLQPTTENVRISTTFQPFTQGRQPTTTARNSGALTGRRTSGFTTTTEIPSSSTFSVEEDLAFLQNLKTVLKTNPTNDDPEAALANRIIALAVEKSLNEIQTGKPDTIRSGKNIAVSANNLIPTTTNRPIITTRPTTTTTRPTTTTTPRPTTTQRITTTFNGPSIEDDIKQFQEDTKLLQALLKATGQDPSKLNLPTLPPNINVSPKVPNTVNEDLQLLSNLLASPSPLNEAFDPLTPKPFVNSNKGDINSLSVSAATIPFGAKIAVRDDLKNEQDDKKLLQTLIKLQDVQETTTQPSKLTITGQSADEALKKLVQQPGGMISEATQNPMSLSTEYGKSNDALLAALLKEQGFGPTTASSLDEQLRLAALLNQVVVTPKARRTTTTPPPPPPAPRRPILDGLAWLWQQWRETAPGSGPPRPNRGPAPAPAPSARPIVASSSTTNRANWLGSGPFVGNADDRPGNRIPLEPPRSVAAEQPPGRGQLVSAAINVTRAFSQFLGAAIQGAAQTVQSVIRAGQRAASDVYVNGSGGAGGSG